MTEFMLSNKLIGPQNDSRLSEGETIRLMKAIVKDAEEDPVDAAVAAQALAKEIIPSADDIFDNLRRELLMLETARWEMVGQLRSYCQNVVRALDESKLDDVDQDKNFGKN